MSKHPLPNSTLYLKVDSVPEVTVNYTMLSSVFTYPRLFLRESFWELLLPPPPSVLLAATVVISPLPAVAAVAAVAGPVDGAGDGFSGAEGKKLAKIKGKNTYQYLIKKGWALSGSGSTPGMAELADPFLALG